MRKGSSPFSRTSFIRELKMNILDVLDTNEKIIKDVDTFLASNSNTELSLWFLELKKNLVEINKYLDEYDETVRNVYDLIKVLTKLP